MDLYNGSGRAKSPMIREQRCDSKARVMVAGSPVRISSSEWSGTRLAGQYSSWWSPGVAIEARSLSLTVGGDIVVDRWLNGNPGSFESVRVNLSPTTITLELPEHGRRILLM